MTYVCEFEFWKAPSGNIVAEPLGVEGVGTFGSDLADAVASAADWLSMFVDDALMKGRKLSPTAFGHVPHHAGQVIAVAVSRKLEDIPAITEKEAETMLGLPSEQIQELCVSGKLESWTEGDAFRISRASAETCMEGMRDSSRDKGAEERDSSADMSKPYLIR